MAKWIAAEKVRAGLRHAVVCPSVTGRTKERIAQSKRTRASCSPQLIIIVTSDANLYLLCLPMPYSIAFLRRYVFCFCFALFRFRIF